MAEITRRRTGELERGVLGGARVVPPSSRICRSGRGTVPRCQSVPASGSAVFASRFSSHARKCAVTDEKTLPALEAAHIHNYRHVEEHTISNGILFRADIHKLFDAGYVTVTPDYHFAVSHRIKEEFENGRDYYKLHGSEIRLPANPAHKPRADALA